MLKCPNIRRDLLVIANYKAAPIFWLNGGVEIKPFKCSPRGYVISRGKIIMLFDPELINPLPYLPFDKNLPFEIWILDNDKVVWCLNE